MRASVEEAVRATPKTRDRYMDFLRAASILVVVFGHWLIGVVYWEGGVIGSRNAIGMTPWLWIATWFLMVMPVFFFVGGLANLVTLRSFRRRANRWSGSGGPAWRGSSAPAWRSWRSGRSSRSFFTWRTSARRPPRTYAG
jgi:Acyltransferase family